MAFKEGGEDVNQVGVDSSSFVLSSGADGMTDVARERVSLSGGEGRGGGVAEGGNWVRVKFMDMGKVVGANGGNRLGCTRAGGGCTEVVMVGGELSIAFRIDTCGG